MLDLALQSHWLGLPLAYWWFLAVMFGGGTGGFLAVAIERIPLGLPVDGRSHCECGRQLLWWENIPVLSWLAFRGRARCCRARIPVWYEITEAGTAAVWVACFSLPTMWLGVSAAIVNSALVLGVAVAVRRLWLHRQRVPEPVSPPAG